MIVLNAFGNIDNTDMKYIQFLSKIQNGSTGWEIKRIYF